MCDSDIYMTPTPGSTQLYTVVLTYPVPGRKVAVVHGNYIVAARDADDALEVLRARCPEAFKGCSGYQSGCIGDYTCLDD